MNRMAIGLLGVLTSMPLLAAEPYVIIDYTKIDARQYCVYNGQLYTRGIRIKTDTGIYTCRLQDGGTPTTDQAVRANLSWVRETL